MMCFILTHDIISRIDTMIYCTYLKRLYCSLFDDICFITLSQELLEIVYQCLNLYFLNTDISVTRKGVSVDGDVVE